MATELKIIARDPLSKPYNARLTEQQWGHLKPSIVRMREDGCTCDVILERIQADGVPITKSQLNSKISKWGLRRHKTAVRHGQPSMNCSEDNANAIDLPPTSEIQQRFRPSGHDAGQDQHGGSHGETSDPGIGLTIFSPAELGRYHFRYNFARRYQLPAEEDRQSTAEIEKLDHTAFLLFTLRAFEMAFETYFLLLCHFNRATPNKVVSVHLLRYLLDMARSAQTTLQIHFSRDLLQSLIQKEPFTAFGAHPSIESYYRVVQMHTVLLSLDTAPSTAALAEADTAYWMLCGLQSGRGLQSRGGSLPHSLLLLSASSIGSHILECSKTRMALNKAVSKILCWFCESEDQVRSVIELCKARGGDHVRLVRALAPLALTGLSGPPSTVGSAEALHTSRFPGNGLEDPDRCGQQLGFHCGKTDHAIIAVLFLVASRAASYASVLVDFDSLLHEVEEVKHILEGEYDKLEPRYPHIPQSEILWELLICYVREVSCPFDRRTSGSESVDRDYAEQLFHLVAVTTGLGPFSALLAYQPPIIPDGWLEFEFQLVRATVPISQILKVPEDHEVSDVLLVPPVQDANGDADTASLAPTLARSYDSVSSGSFAAFRDGISIRTVTSISPGRRSSHDSCRFSLATGYSSGSSLRNSIQTISSDVTMSGVEI